MDSLEDYVNDLLKTPEPETVTKYYSEFSNFGFGNGLSVKQTKTMGKGVFAEKRFNIGDEVLEEPVCVGMQHIDNKSNAFVCSHCFKFIGSLELQIVRKILSMYDGILPSNEEESTIPSNEVKLCSKSNQNDTHTHINSDSVIKNEKEKNFVTEEKNRSEKEMSDNVDGCEDNDDKDDNDDDNDDDDYGDDDDGNFDEEDENEFCELKKLKAPENLKQILLELLTEKKNLPLKKNILLPEIVECVGECTEEVFCSHECSQIFWENHHSLLCSGRKSKAKNFISIQNFKNHADETNDSFHLVAQVIAQTISRAEKIFQSKEKILSKNFETPNFSSACDLKNVENFFPFLKEAWIPFAMAHKNIWWECVSLPHDVDVLEESKFREEIKELAKQSLEYLKEAIFDARFAPIFSLQVFGLIMGMFEQNNLDVVVNSPVEKYFSEISKLPEPEKAKANEVIIPLLESLGPNYNLNFQGNAFYLLQSCINHSCSPNAYAFKRENDLDGRAILIACKNINPGDEITISYIDESFPLEERQTLLLDYGFTCHCELCVEERLMVDEF